MFETIRRKEIVLAEYGVLSRSRWTLRRLHVYCIIRCSASAHPAFRRSAKSPDDVTDSAYTGALEARSDGWTLANCVTTIIPCSC